MHASPPTHMSTCYFHTDIWPIVKLPNENLGLIENVTVVRQHWRQSQSWNELKNPSKQETRNELN